MAFMAAVIPYLQVAGTIATVVGAISKGVQAKRSAEYNADVARNNAIAARQQAAANAEAQGRESRRRIGAMRASYGAAGVALEGSPLDVIESSAMEAEIDRQNILYSGEMKAQGYENTAGLEIMKGESAVTGSLFSAGSSLLTGAAEQGWFQTPLKRTN